ncbi:MAG TPA: hypothetical protein VGI95_17635 [Caulobacteraceae bacterium]|jgi:hypothetical protein
MAAAGVGGGAGQKHSLWDVADLVSKLVLPIVILIATFWYDGSENKRKSTEATAQREAADKQAQAAQALSTQQNCIDLRIKLISVQCVGKDCSTSADVTSQIVSLGQLLSSLCTKPDAANSAPVAASVKAAVLNASQVTHDVNVSAAGQQVAGVPPPAVSVAPANVAATPSAGLQAATAAPGRDRVFIQFADPAQAAAASALRTRLNASTFNSQALISPGVQKVTKAPGRTELRCFKAADCAQANQLAAYIGAIVGQPVVVRDLHLRFEADASVKQGNFELWFGPGAISINESGGGGFS